MSSYAPDVRQFHKQRQADAMRHARHVQQQQGRFPAPSTRPAPQGVGHSQRGAK